MYKMILTILIVLLAVCVGYLSITFLGKDNAVEETCERVIQDETGKTIDLSGPDNEAK